MPRWEIAADGWKQGDHCGTRIGPRGLELTPGVSRGSYELTLPRASSPFTRLVATMNPEPWPVGSGVRLSVRVGLPQGWSRWHSLGVYGSGRDLPRSESTPQTSETQVAADLLSCTATETRR